MKYVSILTHSWMGGLDFPTTSAHGTRGLDFPMTLAHGTNISSISPFWHILRMDFPTASAHGAKVIRISQFRPIIQKERNFKFSAKSSKATPSVGNR